MPCSTRFMYPRGLISTRHRKKSFGVHWFRGPSGLQSMKVWALSTAFSGEVRRPNRLEYTSGHAGFRLWRSLSCLGVKAIHNVNVWMTALVLTIAKDSIAAGSTEMLWTVTLVTVTPKTCGSGSAKSEWITMTVTACVPECDCDTVTLWLNLRSSWKFMESWRLEGGWILEILEMHHASFFHYRQATSQTCHECHVMLVASDACHTDMNSTQVDSSWLKTLRTEDFTEMSCCKELLAGFLTWRSGEQSWASKCWEQLMVAGCSCIMHWFVTEIMLEVFRCCCSQKKC